MYHVEFLRDANNYALKILELLREQTRREYNNYDKMKEVYNTQIDGLNDRIKEIQESRLRKQEEEHQKQQMVLLQILEEEAIKLDGEIAMIDGFNTEYEEVGFY